MALLNVEYLTIGRFWGISVFLTFDQHIISNPTVYNMTTFERHHFPPYERIRHFEKSAITDLRGKNLGGPIA